jgi:putative spermidine/putrescine transport system ATP-binding protein
MATLALKALTRRFGPTVAVDALSLDVADGEFLCLLGPSGCGKSTALRCVAGFEEPDGGDILIDGVSAVATPPNRRATGMVFQSHALWSHMTVEANIAFGLKLRKLARATIRQKVGAVLDLLGLAGLERRYPRQLSGGQQQRVALARSLVLEPKILLLDEPFSSLDAHLRVRLREELKAIQRRLNQTTVFVTHDQEEALTLADRIAIMNGGALEQVDTPGAVYDRPETLFVAGFIGAMNILPAKRTGSLLEAAPFSVPLSAREAQGLGQATRVDLAARPEDIEIVAQGLPDAIAGRVEQVIDLGAVRHVLVDCGPVDGGRTHRIKVQAPRQLPVAPGDAAGLRLLRALVYSDGRQPMEIVQRHSGAVLAFRRSAGGELA